ncbi:MAG TPA: response regulator [Lacunisphaera sp.]|jgi:two-component system chemotaxis response regulator CheY
MAKILIIDDSSLARRTLRQLLEAQGHTVEDAVDGASGLERFLLNSPELVILDMVMTGMYGLDVLAKMKELDASVKVVVATADIQKSTAEQAKTAGAKGILNKPVNKNQLATTVSTVLAGGDTWN